MKQKKILRFCLLLLLLVFFLDIENVNATESVSKLENEKENIRTELENNKEQVDQLEEKKEGLEGYLEELNLQLTEISEKLSELESAISNKERQIDRTNEKIKEIKKQEKKQYEDMKKRIRFMYEQGSESYIDIIFNSDTFADALNHASYVKEISAYDRKMLEKYQNTKKEIEEKEKQLKQEQKELSELQEEAKKEQNHLAEIMQEITKDIIKFEDEISAFEKQARAYEDEIREKETQIEEVKKEQEQIKKAQAQQAQVGTGAPLSATDSELAFLAAIIQCEAEGESYEGQVAVGAVVLNRVRSNLFPNTIIGVIYQAGQFSPVASGRFAVALAKGANASCTSAAIDSLAGANPIGSALFFKRNDFVTQGQVIGNHVFH
ncbi:cell wall hydrolase [Anaerosacchariphilus polymeriproducens]|nr:cell wall hydrolase [Anaerosacchariphilus polymeriproducens]